LTALRTEKAFGMSIPVYPPEDEDSRVAAVVARFDAERVHAVMSLLNWRWARRINQPSSVPTVEEIRANGTQLLAGTLRGFVAGEIPAGSGWGSGGQD
jgi:hypothetical protein